MEKLIELFKNHEGKNWTLFLIILGVVHSAWWFNTFDFIKEFGTQNPYFIFLEILFIASSITRILIVIDIFYILAHFCLVDDLLKFLWKKRRDEWRRWEEWIQYNMQQMHLFEERFDDNESKVQFWKSILGNTYGNLVYLHNINIVPFNTQFNIVRNYDAAGYPNIPYHIKYWIKLEIKEYEPQKSFLDKTIIVGKKIGKYILSHVQKH